MDLRSKHPTLIDLPMQGFVSRIDEINTLAEQSPGFIWRLQDDSGNATSIRAFDDPNLLLNMSVWKDVASLRHFGYKSVHVELLRNRHSWFNAPVDAYQVLWWLPENERPTLEHANQKLKKIQSAGPSAEAFNFSTLFEPPVTDGE